MVNAIPLSSYNDFIRDDWNQRTDNPCNNQFGRFRL